MECFREGLLRKRRRQKEVIEKKKTEVRSQKRRNTSMISVNYVVL